VGSLHPNQNYGVFGSPFLSTAEGKGKNRTCCCGLLWLIRYASICFVISL